MVKYYVARIKEGKITIEDVPHRWRDAVADDLAEESEVAPAQP